MNYLTIESYNRKSLTKLYVKGITAVFDMNHQHLYLFTFCQKLELNNIIHDLTCHAYLYDELKVEQLKKLELLSPGKCIDFYKRGLLQSANLFTMAPLNLQVTEGTTSELSYHTVLENGIPVTTSQGELISRIVAVTPHIPIHNLISDRHVLLEEDTFKSAFYKGKGPLADYIAKKIEEDPRDLQQEVIAFDDDHKSNIADVVVQNIVKPKPKRKSFDDLDGFYDENGMGPSF